MKKASIKIIDNGMLDEISNIIPPTIELEELVSILGITKITMLIESNRLQSLILCELKQSYSIQSQRYCRYDNLDESVIFEGMDLFTEDEQIRIKSLLKDSMNLYTSMTEIKEGHENVTKFTKKDFVHGIPIDDARYCLPTAFSCNCEMTIDGDKLLDFIMDISSCGYFDDSFIADFMLQLPSNITMMFTTILNEVNKSKIKHTVASVSDLPFSGRLLNTRGENPLNDETRVVLISKNKSNDMLKTGAGALMCTTSGKSPFEIYKMNNEFKMKRITERVACNMKHTSIAENSFMTFMSKMSIACYNQYIRHRHHNVKRPKLHPLMFSRLWADGKPVTKSYITPDSIENSKFAERFHNLMYEIEYFMSEVTFKMGCTERKANALIQLFPMGTEITVIINTNLINELKNVSPKRTCMNAQWEIRKITHQKLEIIKNLIGEDNKLLEMARPNCMQECGCTEGKFNCGDNSEVRKLFLGEDV